MNDIFDDKIKDPKPGKDITIDTTHISWPHYYGDIVRKFLFAAAILMLLGLPFFSDVLPIPVFFSLICIVAVGFFAGLTNPIRPITIVIDTLISIIGTVVFEYSAVINYQMGTDKSGLFWMNQLLAILFLCALYFSTKTVRAMVLERKVNKL